MISDHDKRQLLIIAAATAVLLGLIYAFVIRTEQRLLEQVGDRKVALMAQAMEDRAFAAQWETWQARVTASSNRLRELERELPTGDIYRWQLQRFLNPRAQGISVVQAEPPRTAEPLIPGTNQTYATVGFSLDGKASYHDFGRYLAAIENQYIHMRVERLEMIPTMPDVLDSEEARKLFFQLEFISLSQSPSGLKAPEP